MRAAAFADAGDRRPCGQSWRQTARPALHGPARPWAVPARQERSYAHGSCNASSEATVTHVKRRRRQKSRPAGRKPYGRDGSTPGRLSPLPLGRWLLDSDLHGKPVGTYRVGRGRLAAAWIRTRIRQLTPDSPVQVVRPGVDCQPTYAPPRKGSRDALSAIDAPGTPHRAKRRLDAGRTDAAAPRGRGSHASYGQDHDSGRVR